MKEVNYQKTLKIIKSLVESEKNLIANLANISAVIKEEFAFHWVGFYLVNQSSNELILGPFQGPLACTRIAFGKGVCGSAWKQKKSLIVPDVHKFQGHIACSAQTNSEIVIPIIKEGVVFGVLDIDSAQFDDFDEIDRKYLESIVDLI